MELAVLSGTLLGLAVFFVVAWWYGWDLVPRHAARRRPARMARVAQRSWVLAGAGLAAGVVGWQVTGLPVLVVVGPLAAVGLPWLLSDPVPAQQIARLEALEEWTRSLSGVLGSGQGLEHALIATVRSAPRPIAGEVQRLAGRIASRHDTAGALRAFAEELDDTTADQVALQLITASRSRGGGLVALLTRIAESVADQVKARRQVEAERAKSRASARWVTLISAIILGALTLTGDFIDPYRTPAGQLLLLLLLAAYVAALLWMKRLSAGPKPVRLVRVSHDFLADGGRS
ncbi:type II secretion system F family protein [Antribacter gilvus]|uniref:type II secretion system F family protein n=1 Tax=Antribacter gilvus TaxID=2304675 RepID=UPI000F7B1726|nr:type II secretion system F family protein [Antribacter gilvus]